MPFRDETECHLCGQTTLVRCPVCGNGSCEGHTFASQNTDLSRSDRALAEELVIRLGVDHLCLRCLDEELEKSGGPFVVIHQAFDPIQAEMLVAALRDSGFAVRAIGTRNAALVGAGQQAFGQTIETPSGQAEEARALIRTLLSGGDLDEADETYGEDESSHQDCDEEVRRSQPPTSLAEKRRRDIAAGVVALFPGASHYYCRRPWTGAILTTVFAVGCLLLLAGEVRWGPAVMAGAVVCDLLGGQLAVTAYGNGRMPRPNAQLVHGLLWTLAITMVAAVWSIP